MDTVLSRLIFVAGVGQVGVLVASALVPFRLNWRDELRALSRLHRQMHWVYGGYVVMAIITFAALSIFNSRELASGSGLARGDVEPRSTSQPRRGPRTTLTRTTS